ncbi:MAG: protein kinase domain-containing protein [Planctomycetota bacterium]|jgi:serine/threonine-protein kinase
MAYTKAVKALGATGGGTLNLRRGRRLGKYRLIKRLGEGGTGEVWKARDTVEGISVALKIPMMDVNGARDSKVLYKEIRLVTKLRHRHIMPVKNADIINDHIVLATELSPRTLDDCSKPMSTSRILFIIGQVLEGLAYAHRHHLIHCDVTPGNIFLFPNSRAALGDFSISLKLQGRMETIDDYGTPGYVAPEQAYGRPTYRSDCFSAALILYEYITGTLPRWPFKWPLRGHKRLVERTSAKFAKFMRQCLAVDPDKRFRNAEEMLNAMHESTPKWLMNKYKMKARPKIRGNWRQMRREAYIRRYQKVLFSGLRCRDCGESIDERMQICPWCGSTRNKFDSRSKFSHICHRCHKGVLPEWKYCGWCYGAGFESPSKKRSKGMRYHSECKHCGGKLMRFMRYCPWCRRKVIHQWQVSPFPEVCGACGWPVDSSFWNHCPWCKQVLIE